MDGLKSIISIKINSNDYKIANEILENLGLDMNNYINMAIKQLIYKKGLPFDDVCFKPNKELLDAIKEGDDIINGKINSKGYHNMYKLLEDLKSE